jgi:hypothetical protein
MDQLIGQSWQFADAVFGFAGGVSTLLSTIKIRNAGFTDCIDTMDMFRTQIERLRAQKILPQ